MTHRLTYFAVLCRTLPYFAVLCRTLPYFAVVWRESCESVGRDVFKKSQTPIWKVVYILYIFFFQKFSKKVLTHMTHRLTRLGCFWAHESLEYHPLTQREGQTPRSPLGRARDREIRGRSSDF